MKNEPLRLAIQFHETYERLAPQFGYETRTETREFDAESSNGQLMIAVCEEILNAIITDHERLTAEVEAAKDHIQKSVDFGSAGVTLEVYKEIVHNESVEILTGKPSGYEVTAEKAIEVWNTRDTTALNTATEREKALIVLLKLAKCPVCDGSGGNPSEDGYGGWIQVQCRWCFEKNLALAAVKELGEK